MSVPATATFEASVREACGRAIEAGHVPGAVVLAGLRRRRVLELACGHRALVPQAEPMTLDTIFDMASLTKPMATTVAALLLHSDGVIPDWDTPVAQTLDRPIPEGKSAITFRHLLTHTSGLPPYVNADTVRRGYPGLPGHDQVIEAVLDLGLQSPPGAAVRYSCLNFILAARAIQTLTCQRLDAFLGERVWGPIRMCDTSFFPDQEQTRRCAPTERIGDACLRGTVHDPLARLIQTPGKYCSGNAGLFSTARDLEELCLVLLHDGRGEEREAGGGEAVLPPGSLGLVTRPQTQRDGARSFSIGWNVYEPDHGFGVPLGAWPTGVASRAIGHSGYTGTMVWLHPASGSYLLVLTNRAHPDDKGTVHPLRTAVIGAMRASIAAAAATMR